MFIKLPFKIMESNYRHETTLFPFNPITLLYNYCLLFHSPPGYSIGICNGHNDILQVSVLLFFFEYYFKCISLIQHTYWKVYSIYFWWKWTTSIYWIWNKQHWLFFNSLAHITGYIANQNPIVYVRYHLTHSILGIFQKKATELLIDEIDLVIYRIINIRQAILSGLFLSWSHAGPCHSFLN